MHLGISDTKSYVEDLIDSEAGADIPCHRNFEGPLLLVQSETHVSENAVDRAQKTTESPGFKKFVKTVNMKSSSC